ncbi:hypothetical protein H9P43_006981 [Blastocladiella emersonii ATCC 22665]|nr:hypothetical protein H9P43_006981 [Blastocladiella emersonii ATCC 22665]
MQPLIRRALSTAARAAPAHAHAHAPATAPRIVQVAIDGPAASGKSSCASAVAARLHFAYVDSGAFFRCITLKALRRGPDPPDWRSFVADSRLAIAPVALDPNTGRVDPPRISLDGEDVTAAIRDPIVTAAVARLAALPAVRDALLDKKRALAGGIDGSLPVAGGYRGVVMDGRDIGSVVFPNASVKVFLTADPLVRAKRRLDELTAAAAQNPAAPAPPLPTLDQLAADIRARDESDMRRSVSPLVCPDGAIRLDSTALSRDDVIARIVAAVHHRHPDLLDARRSDTHPDLPEPPTVCS